MSSNYKIYALIDPITEIIRYIGYTSKTLETRLRYHIYDCKSKNTHKTAWIKGLIKKGQTPIITLLQECNTLQEALELEVLTISKYQNLTNSTSGGETNKVYCPKVIAKMGANRKGKCVGIDNPMYGKKRPDLSARNKVINPESVKKTADVLRIKYNTEEYKTILRDSQSTKISINAIKDGVLIGTYQSKRELADKLNLDRKSVNAVLKGDYSQHKGYTFSIM